MPNSKIILAPQKKISKKRRFNSRMVNTRTAVGRMINWYDSLIPSSLFTWLRYSYLSYSSSNYSGGGTGYWVWALNDIYNPDVTGSITDGSCLGYSKFGALYNFNRVHKVRFHVILSNFESNNVYAVVYYSNVNNSSVRGNASLAAMQPMAKVMPIANYEGGQNVRTYTFEIDNAMLVADPNHYRSDDAYRGQNNGTSPSLINYATLVFQSTGTLGASFFFGVQIDYEVEYFERLNPTS